MIYKTKFADKELKIETNSLASQASGSVLVSFGQTVVLGTATIGETEVETDFLPLTVEYQERFYASGKIGGSRYIRREGKPSEAAVLTARMIDRSIRPYFPKNLRREVQVVLTVFAFDEENDPDFPAFLAASLSLLLSNIPWNGPVGGVRIGIPKANCQNPNTNSQQPKAPFVLNPTYKQRENAKLDLFVSGIEDQNGNILFNMLDGEGEEISEEEILSGINFSKEPIKKLISLQKEIQKKEFKEKLIIESNNQQLDTFYKKYLKKIRANLLLQKEENGKKKSTLAQQKLREEIGLDKPSFETLVRKVLHKMILEENLRPDGREMDQLREIICKAGILPRTHGSALFFRGLTHVISIVTLGAPGDQLLLEGMEITGTKRFLHHYNFPPYSTGEVKPIRAPGRREIGHGALVEKALKSLIPETEKFPYTIRVVSECLSSNGSTSMASVCASSLALFDAGVPLKRSVAGISCGLIVEDDNSKPISDRKYKILTDIQGPEDSLGDMDFKIAGTQTGVTALQLDVKIRGLTLQIIKDTLCAARKAREKILKKMENVLPRPRPQLSPFAPQILSIKINPEKIREVIGPGGTMINKIIEETDTSIDIENNGLIFVTAKDKEKAKQAINWIKGITREIKVGEVFRGRVEKIMNFGLLIELLPNQVGLLHISEIFPKRPFRGNLSQKFRIGQIIPVRVKNIDQSGRITLSLVKKRPY